MRRSLLVPIFTVVVLSGCKEPAQSGAKEGGVPGAEQTTAGVDGAPAPATGEQDGQEAQSPSDAAAADGCDGKPRALKGRVTMAEFRINGGTPVEVIQANRVYMGVMTEEATFPKRYTTPLTKGYVGSEFTLDTTKDYVKSAQGCDVCWNINISIKRDQTNQGTDGVAGFGKDICVSTAAGFTLKYGAVQGGVDSTIGIEWTGI